MVLVLRCADSCVSGVPPNGTTCSGDHKLADDPFWIQPFSILCSAIIGRVAGIKWQTTTRASNGGVANDRYVSKPLLQGNRTDFAYRKSITR